MKVLLVGSGGREHALAWALSKSLLTKLYASAMQDRAACRASPSRTDFAALAKFADGRSISRDRRRCPAGRLVGCVGSMASALGRQAAMLKLRLFKDLCREPGIHRRLSALHAPVRQVYAEDLGYPVVIKADGWPRTRAITATAGIKPQAIDFMFEAAGGVTPSWWKNSCKARAASSRSDGTNVFRWLARRI